MKIKAFNPLHEVEQFMHEHGWYVNSCHVCKKTFFSKNNNLTKNTCNWRSCCDEPKKFLSFSRKKITLTPAQISSHFREYFTSIGYKDTAPKNIGNTGGTTDLTIAGVQILDHIIHHNVEPQNEKIFVSQPCIRMQYQSNTDLQNGFSTSFVNICTEEVGLGLKKHLTLVDQWYSALSKLGLHMKDFSIVLRTTQKDWGTGKFSSIELFLSYGGLEIGDASYFCIPRKNKTSIPISDIGMGLERVAWGLNKTKTCFDLLTPCVSNTSEEIIDSCKSICLLTLCGIRSKTKGPGLQMRRFAKILSQQYYNYDLQSILLYYFKYWSQFIQPEVSQEVAIHRIRLEVERCINEEMADFLKIPPLKEESTQDFVNRLVYNLNINIDSIRNVIKNDIFK